MTREKLLNHPAYWFEYAQNELFRQVEEYMKRENINKTQLAERLNVSKGYISQILNGNFNYTVKKLIEISLTIGLVPKIQYIPIENVINEDAILKSYYDQNTSFSYNIIPINRELSTIKSDDLSQLPYHIDYLCQETQGATSKISSGNTISKSLQYA
ncbi:helix-turn-helix transcriptional regulator [uncultured Mucilaginibacter sp.]|uniref:helix-turn-helix transcriptional regulator n=1 Tax=uncultured Mucilaginibacter sp. TaxID=797541 RepID=UPI0025FBD3A1|nr:helix-turn-helix transcriptional regulator [uncultured Mucilaginibacter sp.]